MLMEEHGNSPAWDRWPARHRTPAAARAWLASLSADHREELSRKELFFQYVQWIAFSQWLDVHARAESRSVFLMGDIPFGVSRYSADVWANREIFNLNWSGGAPPEKTFKVDRFTEKWGQNWGIPLYRWDKLRHRDFDWWRLRLANIHKIFHFYRIDHVLGFFRIYSFPWTPDRNTEFLELNETEAAAKTRGRLPGFKAFPDDTPEHRNANQKQGEELLRMALAASGDTAVIAEDLGIVPDYVAPTLEKLRIPGFRIPFFLRQHDWKFCDPKTYPRLSIAQPATHDHPPLAAVWADHWANIDAGTNAEHSRWDLKRIIWFSGLDDQEPPREFTDRIHEAFTRAVMQSNSWLVVFQITDVLGMIGRFNVPGSTASTNWSNRLDHTVAQLDSSEQLLAKANTFSRLARENGRTF
jgi:4-alpha-glucanotransferase